jgi:probable rRNA maturation factor
MKIWIRNRQRLIPLDLRRVKRAVQAILADLALPDAELSISFVDDAEIQELNRHHLRRDKPTNVLSFSMREGEFPGLHPDLLGDVVISVETAKRQSPRFGLNEDEMILFLIIHGILHLIGYDHEKGGRQARQMMQKQKELLRSFRIS